MKVNWQGVMPALMTEFDRDGRLDLNATGEHIERCILAGCEGMVLLGTLGENTSLRPAEKLEVLSHGVSIANRRVPVLAGIAEYNTRLAVESAKEAHRAGCDGLMVLPSMVYEQDQREAIHHFRTIAAATDLPIMIYNNPVSYKLDLKPESFNELSDCDTIVAMKESSHESTRITDVYNICGDRFLIFCGVDNLVLENTLFGADGWVAGLVNTFPEEAVALFRLAKQGRVNEALDLYRWFMPMLHLDVDVKLVQYIKLANQLTGQGGEWVRSPRLTLVGEERERIETLIQTGIRTRPDLSRMVL